MGVLAGFLERKVVFEIRCDTEESLVGWDQIYCWSQREKQDGKICCLCPSAFPFKYKQISLLLLWVIISRKKAFCVLLFEVYKMQAAGNFKDAWAQSRKII